MLAKKSNDFNLDASELFKLIVKGSYSELYANNDIDINMFYSNYVDTYIERDVSQLINLKDKIKFQNFMEILASLTGEELAYDTIAKAVGAKVETIK